MSKEHSTEKSEGFFTIHTTKPHLKVKIDDAFWSPRQETNRRVTLWQQYKKLKQVGTIENFHIAAGKKEGEFNGDHYADSDLYKWLEAASYTLHKHHLPDLEEKVEKTIDIISQAQEENGYLNTYHTIKEPNKKWTNLNLMHELYCAGHLFQAAVAHYRATGKENLLNVACSFVEHLTKIFGPEKRLGYPGHQEIALGLLDLYQVTGKRSNFDLAKFFVNKRGIRPSPFQKELAEPEEISGSKQAKKRYNKLLTDENGNYIGTYLQDHRPVREQEKVVGHAVRATYLYSAMAEIAMETKNQELIQALHRLWHNMRTKRMYITGGIGSSHKNEGFSTDYDLPNKEAYAETCAAIGNILWNHRMFQLSKDAKYIDTLERILYNGFLSGVSLDGKQYFYLNPLASDGEIYRQPWYSCACCPPNIARTMASLEKYMYEVSDNTLFVNLYIGSTVQTSFAGNNVEIRQQTKFPWDRKVNITVSVEKPTKGTIAFRLPKWSSNVSLHLNGDPINTEPIKKNGYAHLSRKWEEGDTIKLNLNMSIEFIKAHPKVSDNVGRAALKRGPLIYCLEGIDHSSPLEYIVLPKVEDSLTAEFQQDVLQGMVIIKGEVFTSEESKWKKHLYRKRKELTYQTTKIAAIPYYAWDNREPGAMRVWIRTD